MSTRQVLDHHLRAFSAGDLEETLEDYTDDSVLIEPRGTHRGLPALRAFFGSLFSDLFKPDSYELTMDRVEVEGEVAYIVWHSENQKADVSLGTDTFIIRDGRIALQTFAGKIESK